MKTEQDLEKKEAIKFIFESAVLGLLHRVNYEMTDVAKDLLNGILTASHVAGLSEAELLEAVGELQAGLRERGVNITFVVERDGDTLH